MLTQVQLQTQTPLLLPINTATPDDTIILTSISGLSPADVTLFTGDFARDGGYYQGRRVAGRNVVFNFKLNPDYKNDIRASDLRELLIAQFYEPQSMSDGIQVLLKDDRKPDRYLFCYTEKSEGMDPFTQSLTPQFSTICVDPYLRSSVPVSVTDNNGFVSTPIVYDGSADVGLSITLKVVTATNTIHVNLGGGQMTLTFASNLSVGDLITINTLQGSRAIQRNGVDVMASFTAGQWVTLKNGANTLAVDGGAAGDGKVVTTAYSYRSSWWGV